MWLDSLPAEDWAAWNSRHTQWPKQLWPVLSPGKRLAGYLLRAEPVESRWRGPSQAWVRRWVVLSGSYCVIFKDRVESAENILRVISLWGPGLRQATCSAELEASAEQPFVWAILQGPDIDSEAAQVERSASNTAAWAEAATAAMANVQGPGSTMSPATRSRATTSGGDRYAPMSPLIKGASSPKHGNLPGHSAAKAPASGVASGAARGAALAEQLAAKRAEEIAEAVLGGEDDLTHPESKKRYKETADVEMLACVDAEDRTEWVATLNAQALGCRIVPVTVHCSTDEHIAGLVQRGGPPKLWAPCPEAHTPAAAAAAAAARSRAASWVDSARNPSVATTRPPALSTQRSARLKPQVSSGSAQPPRVCPWGTTLAPLAGYTPAGVLGAGAFGAVLKGAHSAAESSVAVKVMAKPPPTDRRMWKVLVSELMALERMRLAAGSLGAGSCVQLPVQRAGRLPGLPHLAALYDRYNAVTDMAVPRAYLPAQNTMLPGLKPPLRYTPDSALAYGSAAIIADYSVAEDDNHVYVVMECVPGPSLLGFLASPGRRWELGEAPPPVVTTRKRAASSMQLATSPQQLAGSPRAGSGNSSPRAGSAGMSPASSAALVPPLGEAEECPVPLATARALVHDVCLALAVYHAIGLVHRDVKLENVQVTRSGPMYMRAVLLDYGFTRVLPLGALPSDIESSIQELGAQEHPTDSARAVVRWRSALADGEHPLFPLRCQAWEASAELDSIDDEFTTGLALCTTLFGTKYAAAPEIWRRENYTHAVDAWGIGVIAYMLMVGQAPFSDFGGASELRARVLSGTLRSCPAWDALPEDARDFVQRLLTVDAAQRMTASQALTHPFLAHMQRAGLNSSPRSSIASASSGAGPAGSKETSSSTSRAASRRSTMASGLITRLSRSSTPASRRQSTPAAQLSAADVNVTKLAQSLSSSAALSSSPPTTATASAAAPDDSALDAPASPACSPVREASTSSAGESPDSARLPSSPQQPAATSAPSGGLTEGAEPGAAPGQAGAEAASDASAAAPADDHNSPPSAHDSSAQSRASTISTGSVQGTQELPLSCVPGHASSASSAGAPPAPPAPPPPVQAPPPPAIPTDLQPSLAGSPNRKPSTRQDRPARIARSSSSVSDDAADVFPGPPASKPPAHLSPAPAPSAAAAPPSALRSLQGFGPTAKARHVRRTMRNPAARKMLVAATAADDKDGSSADARDRASSDP